MFFFASDCISYEIAQSHVLIQKQIIVEQMLHTNHCCVFNCWTSIMTSATQEKVLKTTSVLNKLKQSGLKSEKKKLQHLFWIMHPTTT